MSKTIYRQKNPFGGEVFLDENNHVIGYGRRDSNGKEIFLDKDLCYVGGKEKNLFDAEAYPDKNGKEKDPLRKEPSVKTVYRNRDYSYLGRGGYSGVRTAVRLNGQGAQGQGRRHGKNRIAVWIVLAALLAGLAAALWMILR